MRKLTIIFMLLAAMGCGGGGGSSNDVSAPAFTKDQENAIISGAQEAMDKINKPISDYCRDNPFSSLCMKGSSDPVVYIGFTDSDFSGKTMYHVAIGTYTKAEYLAGGRLKAYYSNQELLYEEATWSVVGGKLIVARVADPSVKTTYTLLIDDEEERYFKTSQKWAGGSVHSIGIFYDQVTGKSQALDFAGRLRIP